MGLRSLNCGTTYQIDYHYLVEPLPDSFWTPYVDIVPFADPDEFVALLPPRDNVTYLESSPQRASLLRMERDFINPQLVLDYRSRLRFTDSEG